MIQIIGLKFTGPSSILNEFISKFRLEFVLGYSGYFVLGYLLKRICIQKKTEIILYVLGLCGLAVTVFAGAWMARTEQSTNIFSDELTVNVLMMTVLINCLKRFAGITNLTFNPIISVLVRALLVFVCSMGISAVLNKIPY